MGELKCMKCSYDSKCCYDPWNMYYCRIRENEIDEQSAELSDKEEFLRDWFVYACEYD